MSHPPRGPRRALVRGAVATLAALAVASIGAANLASAATPTTVSSIGQPGSAIVDSSIGRGQPSLVSAAGFAHPGVVSSRAELDVMRDAVQQGREPWRSAFESVRTDPRASLDYQMLGPIADVKGYNTPVEYTIQTDGFAAHMLTVMWYITGDQRYANQALDIIRAWSAVLQQENEGIHAAPGVARMASAAEILRYTRGSGWTDADTTSFSRLLRVVTSPPETGIDKDNWFMNQAGYADTALLAAAVFLNDRDLYAKYIERVTTGTNPDPGCDVALDRQIEDNGQLNEMGRDQGHSNGDLATLSEVAQTSWIQSTQGNLGDLGVDVFAYRNNRLLSGTEFFQRYNLGFDVPWKAHNVDCLAQVYTKISTTGRGTFTELQSDTNTMSPVSSLTYNHYRYVEGVPDSAMPSLATVARQTPTDWNDLLWTPAAAAAPGRPAGPPGPAKDVTPDARFERFQAAGWSSTSGKDQIRNDPWTDADGSRLIVRDIVPNGWIEYKDFDFGVIPRDTFLLNGGASTKVPTQVAIHLDSPTGELLGTATIAPTGWYTIFETTTSKLSRPLTGKHTIVLQFSGSSNVYHWQGAVNWIKVAAGSAHTSNPVAAAPEQVGTTAGPVGVGRTLGDGQAVGWRDLDFDNGALSFRARVMASGGARLELRTGSPDGPAVATYALPDTRGEWADIERTSPRQALLGRHDVYLVQVGGAPVSLDTVEWTSGQPKNAARAAVDRLATVSGRVEVTRGDELRITDGTVSLPTVEFKSGAHVLALTYRSARGATVSVYSDTLDSKPIATGELPATPEGGLRSVNLPLDPSPTRAHMLFVRVEGAANLQTLQADPVNANPPSVDMVAPTQVTTGTEVRIPVAAVDPDGHPVTVRAVDLPAGAHIDVRTGDIVWVPTDSQVGTQVLRVVADDGSQLTLAERTVAVVG